ncbi:hypothetical protein CN360_00945 [Bacillus cereus]|nr:hypothetical protein COM98_17180 [Bacillus cereus]PEY86471.1 hypothetical protein CN351_05880 [Bacillus thuringiensis]PEF94833.1 hypothetical protein CON46_02215 [Bacillus cereus]PEW36165.1 hypothetical protein CN441_01160 [Bacillus cereus]PEY96156.1 hypothetical protein CN360_00945 [Bacillus cereus]
MKYKKFHIVTTKFINLCCLKTNELKALDCLRKTTSAFLFLLKTFYLNSRIR